jgi:integrase/recombinase XerD
VAPVGETRTLLLALVEAAHSYAERPLGAIAARYVRWLRNERGATASTVVDYESVLGRVVVLLDEMGLRELDQVTTEDLRLVIDALWGEREARTRAKVTSVVRSFLEWCVDERLLEVSPAARIRRPKLPQKPIPLLPEAARDRLLAAAPTARDVFALSVLLDLGVRRNELRMLRVRDVDLARRVLVVMGKGQKARALPLRGGIVLAAEGYLLEELEGVGRGPGPDDFILYPEKRTPPHPKTGATPVHWADPSKPMHANGVHRWWYRMCEHAGLVAKNQRSGLNMHRGRHGFALEMRRAVSLEAASQALGHSDLSTTMRHYGHWADDELGAAFEALAASREER